jgi:hypothetical protein
MSRPVSERSQILEKGAQTDSRWGYFWTELGYTMGPQFDAMTLSAAAQAEFTAVERILARALPPQ